MKALKSVEVPAPVHIGDVLVKDVAGTGVDIVATKNVNLHRIYNRHKYIEIYKICKNLL